MLLGIGWSDLLDFSIKGRNIMSDIKLNFQIIGDSVWMSLKDFHKLLKEWKKQGAKIDSSKLIIKPQKKQSKI